MRFAGLLAVCLVAALLSGCGGSHNATSVAKYTVQDLGVLGGMDSSTARAVNNQGRVALRAGQTALPADLTDSMPLPCVGIWANGESMLLQVPAGASDIDICDINDEGQAVGTIGTAVIWENGNFIELETPYRMTNVRGEAINDSGDVVGSAWGPTPAGSGMHAFLWEGGLITNMGPGEALDTDDSGRIAGYRVCPGVPQQAAVWEKGAATDIVIPGSAGSRAEGINDAGQVVGRWDEQNGRTHAFLWQDGLLTNLDSGGRNACAHAINARGEIVGECTGHAAIWQNGRMTDLNNFLPAGSGWELITAWDINDRGVIVGEGKHNGFLRAFMLTPGR